MDITLIEALTWLSAGGSVVLAMAGASYAAEHVAWYQSLSGEHKRWVMGLTSVMLALLAWATITYVPTDVIAQLEQPYRVIMLTIAAMLGSQAWHKLVNRSHVPTAINTINTSGDVAFKSDASELDVQINKGVVL